MVALVLVMAFGAEGSSRVCRSLDRPGSACTSFLSGRRLTYHAGVVSRYLIREGWAVLWIRPVKLHNCAGTARVERETWEIAEGR